MKKQKIPLTDYRFLTLKYCLEFFTDLKGKILDVGCGAGEISKKIKKQRPDLELFGVDIDSQAIALAKKDKQSVSFKVADVYNLPFDDNYFDATFNHHFLEHLSKPEQALAEIYRVTKKGGTIFSSIPLEGNWSSIHHGFYRFPRYKALRIKYTGHLKQYDFKTIISLFENTGFVINDYKWSGFIIGQLANFLYYPLANFLDLPTTFLTENELLKNKKSWYSRLGRSSKNIISLLMTLESLYIPRVPQDVIHIYGKKI